MIIRVISRMIRDCFGRLSYPVLENYHWSLSFRAQGLGSQREGHHPTSASAQGPTRRFR